MTITLDEIFRLWKLTGAAFVILSPLIYYGLYKNLDPVDLDLLKSSGVFDTIKANIKNAAAPTPFQITITLLVVPSWIYILWTSVNGEVFEVTPFMFAAIGLYSIEKIFIYVECHKVLRRTKAKMGTANAGIGGEDKDFNFDKASGFTSQFGFNRSRFNGSHSNHSDDQKQQTRQPEKEMPYGFEKRHPKDAKLWAYVDDSNASDQERKTALNMILKNQAKRQGRTSKEIKKAG